MAVETLSPVLKQKFFDNNGAPLVGGKFFSYAAGTTTKIATYTDSTGATPNANPVILDFRGECNCWVPPNVAYKFTLAPATDTDPPTNPFWTVDQVTNAQLVTLYGGIDTGAVNAYVLNFTANFTTLTDGIVIYWVPANSNTGASVITVNGLGPTAIVNADGSALSANELVTGSVATIIYKGGQWILMNPAIASFFATGTFLLTPTGLTVNTPVTVRWARAGKVITMRVPPITGTSNATTFTATGVPLGLQIDVGTPALVLGGILATDNSVATYAAGNVNLSAASGTMVFEFKYGAWTAAGTKAMAQFTLAYFNLNNFA